MNHAVRLFVLLLALCFAAPSQAGRAEPLRDHQRSAFPMLAGKPVTMARAHDALAQSGRPRGWVVMEDNPGQMTLRNTIRGKHVVVIKVVYDTQAMTIDYVSSENLNYGQRRGGIAEIHPKYHQWTGMFTQDVMAWLSR